MAAQTIADFYKNTNITMDGSEKTHTFQPNMVSVAFHVNGAAEVTMGFSSGFTDVWTLSGDTKESLSNRSIRGHTVYFNGAAPTVLEIREELGLAS